MCNTEFSADEVHGARSVGRDTDFRPVFDGPGPLLSHIHTCPGCRYSGYRTAFDVEASDEDELIEPVVEEEASLPRPTPSPLQEADFDDLRRYVRSGELTAGVVAANDEPFGASRYLLAGRVHEFVHENDPQGAAHYYLRAAWSARTTGDAERERDSQRELLLRLDDALESEHISEAQEIRLEYLKAEVLRRVGEFAHAIDLFAQVVREADRDDDEVAEIVELAHRQALLASARSATNAVIPDDLLVRQGGVGDLVGYGGSDDEDNGGTGTLN